jgi:hypothetical protein
MNDFDRSLTILLEAGVEFVVIGGVAMYARGSAHLTKDLDLCYDRRPENVDRLIRALAPYHPRLRGAPEDLPFVLDAVTVTRGMNFTLMTDLGALDLLGEVAGLGGYSAALAASDRVELFGKPCNVLTLDGLIRSKRAAGRPRDLIAVQELEALRELGQQQEAKPE